jgi:hypothetical protein
MIFLAIVYEVPPGSGTFAPQPWPAKAVTVLLFSQLAVSVLAALSAPWIWPRRWWLSWVWIFIVVVVTVSISIGASVATTGLNF